MDAEKHPALLMVDTVSSLASIDYRHDEWGVDVTIGASQKALMLPPGLGFNAVSQRALSSSAQARLPRAFWSWEDMGLTRSGIPHELIGLGEGVELGSFLFFPEDDNPPIGLSLRREMRVETASLHSAILNLFNRITVFIEFDCIQRIFL
jgi:hypothetical protein